ncbi:uncharacterized protein PGTG_21958 [Puccinia graminis f. sp. tritici CRL 75-36-700-3]|uniref:Allantoicase domain-containing protein n=1 Tax=Puccinia graminis f. sp. tritici (strain CRL 75-36-700-3 / race SCCL) TaxID=418459 RepID=H6QSY8_PUCGT|nr:uncharacterized protein PGTG_21958 [Puccinia graminis f. sp. tritici CRL 75-36-700-3]EHS63942.1 hypothetical protein PGTG_21958 [Puccinia graminis f. sp. tritici CRL 75-36-700-3]
MTPSVQSIPNAEFHHHFHSLIELSSEALGSSVVAVSDQWFAPAESLLKQHSPVDLSGQFGPNGALYDGWESRRHNPSHDWVIIKLGVASGTIIGFEIDTTFFNGNEAPACSVYGLDRLDPVPDSPDDPQWHELLPVVPLGPSARHLFKIPETKKEYRYLKLNIIPDGGVARFRVYGNPIPVFPPGRFDLASVLLGARVVFTSDQHYGVGSNLILPGRGPKSMDGGWETKRSRIPGHSDFVIIKLADNGFLDYTEIDTNYFIGNFPQMVDLYATVSDQIVPDPSSKWTEILGKSKLGPHQQHYFQLTNSQESFTHVRMTIYPDGGVKRIRLFGRRTAMIEENSESPMPASFIHEKNGVTVPRTSVPMKKAEGMERRLPILPLTKTGFERYGAVIEAHLDSRANSPEIRSKVVNFGTAIKFDNVASLETSSDLNHRTARPNLCLFSCQPWPAHLLAGSGKLEWRLKGLERHQFSSQTFVPLSTHTRTADPLEQDRFNSQPEGKYLIVVALDHDGKPDMDSLRAFLGTKSQGISYFKNVWHAPLIATNNRMDFVCWIYETGDPIIDCELVEVDDVVCEL